MDLNRLQGKRIRKPAQSKELVYKETKRKRKGEQGEQGDAEKIKKRKVK
jgi:hypothetical protein